METLLPSEVARLVLGYLEEEKCQEAAKSFLDASQHLSEYRSIALKGKKYPTKVNGYSLKEVLEEYALVHSIVQDSLSSMTEQPSVGGSMIDCLRFLVRACQPVQVHINLHPQQGQNTSLNKSETPDISSGSSKLRSKKVSPPLENHGKSVTNASSSEPAFSQILPDSSSAQMSSTVNNSQPLSILQSNPQQTLHFVTGMDSPNIQPDQRLNAGVQFNSSSQKESRIDSDCGHDAKPNGRMHQFVENMQVSQGNTIRSETVHMYSEPPPLVPTSSYYNLSRTVKNTSQQMYLPVVQAKEPAIQPTNSDFVPTPQETIPVNPQPSQSGGPLLEPVQSYTVTKCFGSNIVILDSDTTAAAPSTSSSWTVNKQQDDDSKRLQSKDKITTPFKSNMAPFLIEHVSDMMMSNEKIQLKLADEINKTRTPAKPIEDEYMQGLVDADRQSSNNDFEEDSVGSLKGAKKKKRTPKKKLCRDTDKSKNLCGSAVPSFSDDKLPLSKESGLNVNVGINTVALESSNATPAKDPIETETMTPMTKLLKSITSPSGDLFLDPNQFAGLLDMPDSATKSNAGELPSTSRAPTLLQPSQPLQENDNTVSKIIEVPQPNGTTVQVPIVFCESNQQVARYVNEKGVNTICDIHVMPHHGDYLPIIPKIKPGGPSLASCLGLPEEEAPKSKRKPRIKRCLTRGGRKSAGQMHPDPSEASDQKDTVTLYAPDGKAEVHSTIFSYTASSDLPILEPASSNPSSDTPAQNSIVEETKKEESCENNKHDKVSEAHSLMENKEENSEKGNECNMPTLNTSAIRNTPGVNGPGRHHQKRMSLSTPRRRLSHIRALDFNTPPKENDMSLRRANTSPKNMSSSALSPHTANKSSKSVRDGLFKTPIDGSRRRSKAKAHLFKSPEYLLNSSSGFKIPPAAATSTPAEEPPLPPLSKEWDKVNGVSLILGSGLSPVKRSDPPCKKNVFTSGTWDSDLRAIVGNPEPDPVPLRKRKASTSAPKKGSKKSKQTTGKGRKSKAKSVEETNDSQNASNESAGEMARLIEQNIMEDSGKAVSPNKDCSLKSNSALTSDHSEGADQIAGPENKTETSTPGNESPRNEEYCETQNVELKPTNTTLLGAGEEKATNLLSTYENQNIESVGVEDGLTLIANTALSLDEANRSSSLVSNKETSHGLKSPNSESQVKTPVSETAIVAPDKIRLNLATWGESFTFETPMKDMLANMVPQTPRFVNPDSASKEDTPCTKMIKALPFPVASTSKTSVDTPVLCVPPTPTIHITARSPNCSGYFQPIKPYPTGPNSCEAKNSPEEETESLKHTVNQVNLNIETECSIQSPTRNCMSQELSEVSADQKCPQKEVGQSEVTIAGSGCTEESQNNEDCSRIPSDSLSSCQMKPGETKKSSESLNATDEDVGCARFRNYQRKPAVESTVKGWLDQVANNSGSVSIKKGVMSADEADECQIISTCEEPQNREQGLPSSTVTRGRKSAVNKSISNETCPTHESSLPSCPEVVEKIDGVEIEEALDQLHGKAPQKPCSESEMAVTKETASLNTASTSQQKEPILQPEAGSGVSSTNDKGEAQNVVVKTPSSSSVNKQQSTLTSSPSSKKMSFEVPRSKQVVTDDDESSESSSSESSSSSDSESSSSSSEEEDNPVKDNTPTSNQSSPLKTKLDTNPQNAENLNSDQFSEVKEEELKRLGLRRLIPKECKESVPIQLKAPVETKDKKVSDRPVRSRCGQNPVSQNLKKELEQKRQRMVEQLKSNTSAKQISKSPKERKRQVSKPLNISENQDAKKIEQNNVTKDNEISHKEPSKRRSASEPNEKVCDEASTEQHTKSRSASESVRISDDEEFKLHLSGDEKEESHEAPSGSTNTVEPEMDALHSDIKNSKKMPMLAISATVKSSQPKAKCGADVTSSKVDDAPVKMSSKGTVSSKAADKALKALLEKGFGCSLPPPPNEKIKKVFPNPAATKFQEKSKVKCGVETVKVQGTLTSEDFQLSKQGSSKLNDRSDQLEATVLESLSDEEGCTKIIDTSISSRKLDVKIVYKGLGSMKPKQDSVVLKRQRLTLDGDTQVCITPSPLFNLCDFTPNVRQVDFKYRKIRTSDASRTENVPSRSELYRRHLDCQAGTTRQRVPWDRVSRDKAFRRQDDFRSRRSRSRSPRLRRSGDYGDHDNLRDSHSSQNHLSRRRGGSSPRKRKTNSSSSNRYSRSETRQVELSSSRPKAPNRTNREEGELLSSDSDTEISRANARKSPCSPRNTKGRDSKISGKNVKRHTGVIREKSSRTLLPQTPQSQNMSNFSNERTGPKPKEKCTQAENKPTRSERTSKHDDADEDLDDLDNINFPVLGDDEALENSSETNPTTESNSVGMITRRRAPPRSVNAHKTTTVETSKPFQTGKRKLSTSPGGVSEESCESSLGGLNTEAKTARLSIRSKKTTHGAKILKQNEMNGVPTSDMIKNLDVEDFLTKIHG